MFYFNSALDKVGDLVCNMEADKNKLIKAHVANNEGLWNANVSKPLEKGLPQN